MSTGSEDRSLSFVLLTVALVLVVALSGCVQGQDDDSDDQGFDPSGNAGSPGNGGADADSGGNGGTGGDENLSRLERAQRAGFEELEAENEVLRLVNERREARGQNPLSPSQSLKVAAEDFSEQLADRQEIESRVENETVLDIEYEAQEVRNRYIKHNAFDCRKSGKMFIGQVNHATLFNRTLRTSAERLIRYNNAELLALGVVEDWTRDDDSSRVVFDEAFRQAGVGIYFDPSESNVVYVTMNLC